MAAPALAAGDDRRTVILRAAVRVIADAGLESLTHRRVAAAAGVPLGSTTYYFASRDDLVREAFRYYAAATLATLDDGTREYRVLTVPQLVDLLVEVMRREFDAPDMVRVEYELILRAARDPVLAKDVVAYERELAARLAEMLETFAIAHPFDAARSIVALLRGFELERLTRPDADLEDLRRRLLAVLEALHAQAPSSKNGSPSPRQSSTKRRPARRKSGPERPR